MRRRCWETPGVGGLGAFVLVAVMVMGGAGGPIGSAHSAFDTSISPSVVIRPGSIPNGNLSISIPQPTAQVVPGMFLVDQYRISILSNLSNFPPGVTIWVPQTIAVFNFSSQTIKNRVDPSLILNFTAGGPSASGLFNTTTLLKFGGQFNDSAPAILTSQLLSFMSNWPDGRYN